ncbi:hypothetical protein V1478_016260 [Vespula squamosa]|uniref:Uncharacterized protein n=1 Tax=Vespula squamosa TaxID=30214 RepID=A0ABD1ZZA5_VESSQ
MTLTTTRAILSTVRRVHRRERVQSLVSLVLTETIRIDTCVEGETSKLTDVLSRVTCRCYALKTSTLGHRPIEYAKEVERVLGRRAMESMLLVNERTVVTPVQPSPPPLLLRPTPLPSLSWSSSGIVITTITRKASRHIELVLDRSKFDFTNDRYYLQLRETMKKSYEVTTYPVHLSLLRKWIQDAMIEPRAYCPTDDTTLWETRCLVFRIVITVVINLFFRLSNAKQNVLEVKKNEAEEDE